MQITKAVITAAGRGVRLYPAADTVQKGMLPIVDRDGLSKPTLQIIAEEALDSGIEEICVVCAPGDEEAYRYRFALLRENLLNAYREVEWAQEQASRIDNLVRRLRFAVQGEARGYGHSVYCAKDFVGSDAFLLLLGDHVYVSDDPKARCAQQLIRIAEKQDCAVAAVQATHEHLVGLYGTLRAKRVADQDGLYQIERIEEKPSLTRAELELQTPGLRVGHYLCFFGMHVLPPTIFDLLGAAAAEQGSDTELQLTPSLQRLSENERYLAMELAGTRYDIGIKFGVLRAQVALGLAGSDHDQMLTTLLELLAEARSHRALGLGN